MDDKSDIQRVINDLGGPDRVVFALISGWLDKNVRQVADKLVGSMDEIIPKDHPLRSSVAERITGVAQSLTALKYDGPVAQVFQRFFDSGQQRWYNGSPIERDWLAEFERFSQEQIRAAADPKAEADRLKNALEVQVALSKSIAASRTELYPPEEGPKKEPVREFIKEFDEVVGGALETLLDRLGVPPLKPHPRPPETPE